MYDVVIMVSSQFIVYCSHVKPKSGLFFSNISLFSRFVFFVFPGWGIGSIALWFVNVYNGILRMLFIFCLVEILCWINDSTVKFHQTQHLEFTQHVQNFNLIMQMHELNHSFIQFSSEHTRLITKNQFSPKTKLSGLKSCPNAPALTESIVPGSKSTRTARGTYFPPARLKTICTRILH